MADCNRRACLDFLLVRAKPGPGRVIRKTSAYERTPFIDRATPILGEKNTIIILAPLKRKQASACVIGTEDSSFNKPISDPL